MLWDILIIKVDSETNSVYIFAEDDRTESPPPLSNKLISKAPSINFSNGLGDLKSIECISDKSNSGAVVIVTF